MRYLILLSALVMQMCLGATYSWSVYVQPLKALTGLAQGPVQLPFTIFYFVFPFTMMIAGNFLPKIGTRTSAMIGGILFGGGWVLASFGHHSFIYTILGIGGLSGIGAGMAYIVPIAVCVRWFPDNKGMVTGIAVAGFGGGAAMVSQIGGRLIAAAGFTPFETFFTFGLAFMTLVFLAGSTMTVPAQENSTQAPRALNPKAVLSHINFRILYMAMLIGLAAGFAVNANLKELYQGVGNATQIGITAVSLFAVANAAGRILWGALFDRISSASAIFANLICQAAILLMAPFLLTSVSGFWAVAFITGFNYGGVLVIFVSSATRCWGAKNVGQVYGWLFTSNIPAALSPILAGFVFDTYQSFNLALYIAAGLLLAGAVLIWKNASLINMEKITAS
jgi:MFS transporter, OFA family, oxalate/formate antiporter